MPLRRAELFPPLERREAAPHDEDGRPPSDVSESESSVASWRAAAVTARERRAADRIGRSDVIEEGREDASMDEN